MELVFAAIIWNAQAITYVPMSRSACEAVWWENFRNWRPSRPSPIVECMKAKWTCERGFQLVDAALQEDKP